VGVSASQFGQIKRRLISILFRQLPSIWSATKGISFVLWLIFDHPHRQHLFPNFLRKYRLMKGETVPILCNPLISPAFHFLMYKWYAL